jgi:hypothetical protein
VNRVPEDEPEPLDVGEDDDLPLRWYVIAAFMIAVIAGFVGAVLLSVLWFATCHDNHPGSVYVAGDSRRAMVCESGHGVAGLLVAAGWVAGFALATYALVRWRRGRVARLLLSGLLVAPMALPVLAFGGLSLTSTECPGEKVRAYQEWVDQGSKGSPPFECRTF